MFFSRYFSNFLDIRRPCGICVCPITYYKSSCSNCKYLGWQFYCHHKI